MAIAGSAVTAMVVAGISFQTANASEDAPTVTAKTLSAPAAGKLASTLVGDLGADAAGSYYDSKTKALVVNVIDTAAAETVREAGAKAKVVTHSLAELKDARGSLTGEASTPVRPWPSTPCRTRSSSPRTVRSRAPR